MLSRTVSLETTESETTESESEFTAKVALAIKALLVGLTPEVKAQALANVLLDLELAAKDRLQELLG